MKTIRYILSICSFILVLNGCSDDDGKVVSNDELEMTAGTYQLVELNINPAQDINNDGNEHILITISGLLNKIIFSLKNLEILNETKNDMNTKFQKNEINKTKIERDKKLTEYKTQVEKDLSNNDELDSPENTEETPEKIK